MVVFRESGGSRSDPLGECAFASEGRKTAGDVMEERLSSGSESRFVRLRDRYTADRSAGADGNAMVIARLASALDAIGWRAADGSSSEEVAADAVYIVAECVARHHSVDKAGDALAELLYRSAATLDGSSYLASAYLPAAEEVLARYARG